MRRWLRTRARRVVALLVVAVIAVGMTIAAWAPASPPPIRTHLETIMVPAGPNGSSAAGTIPLDAEIYLPAVTPAPAVIVAHGFGGTRHSVDKDARRLARAGFVVLAYSARGFGESGGLIALDSLHYEVADARSLIDWLADRPDVLQDAPGDPRVGVTGGSYGGALSLMLAGTDDRIDAVAAVATWYDLDQALFPSNGAGTRTAPDSTTPAAIAAHPDGVFKTQWASVLLASVITEDAAPAGRDDDGAPHGDGPDVSMTSSCGRLMPDVCAAYLQVAQTGRSSPAMTQLLDESSPARVARNITAPTLLVQGQQDTLFGLDQADATARAIAANGTEVAVSWYPGGHSGGPPDSATENRITGWLEYYLASPPDRDDTATPSKSWWYFTHGTVSSRGELSYRRRQISGYPGIDEVPRGSFNRSSMVLHGQPHVIVNPPGGIPAAMTSLPGELAGQSGASPAAGAAASLLAGLSTLPGQSATFTADPVVATTTLLGSATVTLQVASVPSEAATGPNATGQPASDDSTVLYFSLVNMGAPGDSEPGTDSGASASLIGGAVAPVRIDKLPADGTPVTVTVQLPAVSYQLDQGDALGVRVSTTNQAFAGNTAPAAYRITPVTEHAADTGTLRVPIGHGSPLSGGDRSTDWAAALLAVIILGAVALLIAGRDRRQRKPELAGDVIDQGDAVSTPPVVIRHLHKQYPGGVHAVDDVSFTVSAGRVVGLLGPNGAGKTTTLRMALGLITPTAGEVELFGETVRPGAEVLRRVGSFVEGSGFLPHLSGGKNLELYWRATGRPAPQAQQAAALEIAGLGDAINRKVKTYSQGMRQRLAIAQAMLGLPDLLILDEPTNGLDPPQIHAMRDVIKSYAATGRTVVISSHLLAEVEQTCSDVIIMAAGRTIATGTVADMVARSGEIYVTTAEPDAAQQTLTALDGIGAIDRTDSGIAVDAAGLPVEQLIRALMDAQVPISAIAPRNRLEEVFLGLVESAGGTP